MLHINENFIGILFVMEMKPFAKAYGQIQKKWKSYFEENPFFAHFQRMKEKRRFSKCSFVATTLDKQMIKSIILQEKAQLSCQVQFLKNQFFSWKCFLRVLLHSVKKSSKTRSWFHSAAVWKIFVLLENYFVKSISQLKCFPKKVVFTKLFKPFSVLCVF